ncbi:lipopolysaccharide biosynthesis protein [Photobacterium alginatilyticum]|uniref:lipopolysaccharide biosynthesis protein n=1 Tax=Photobacterium alginatilyticum TaxID=1775171 RepID=UPI00406868BB
MSYKKGISVGLINVPIQVLSALAANVIIINQIGKSNLDVWYLLISTMPLFTALELSFPSLMLRNLNKKAKTRRVVRDYVLKAICLSTLLQAIAILSIKLYLGVFESSVWLFFVGAYLRTIANIIISVPYSRGLIVHEKIYRVSYASLLPVIIVALFTLVGDLELYWIYIVWFVSSVAVFVFALFSYNKSDIELDSVEYCSKRLKFKFKENLSLLATTVPGLFIFNLSIYYLKAYASNEDVVTYGFILQLVNVYYLVNNIIPSVFAPNLSKSFFSGNKISSEVLRIVDCNVCLAILAFIFIFLVGEDILGLLFSTSFDVDEIRSILFCIAVFVLVESVQVTLTYFGISTGKYNYHYQSLCSAILVTALSYYLIPLYGYLGLVYSVCTAQVLTCLPFNSYLVCKHLEIPPVLIIKRMLILLVSFFSLLTLQQFIRDDGIFLQVLCFAVSLTSILMIMYKLVLVKFIGKSNCA